MDISHSHKDYNSSVMKVVGYMAIFLMFIKANLVNMYILSPTSRVFQHIKSCILKNWKSLPSKLIMSHLQQLLKLQL